MKSDTASSEARTGLAVVAVWWLAESAAVMRTEVPGSRTLVSLFLLSCLPGASVALSLWALRRGGHAARLVGSGLAAAAAIFLTASLFAGPWIRAQTWAVLGRWLVVAGIALSAWFVGRRWQQRQHETRAGRLVALAMGLAALWLDDRLYPHHYPDLHRGIALAFLVAITFALRGLRGIPAAGSSLTVLTILAVATLAVGLIPGTDIDTRRQLLRTTRWTGPILASCLPTPAPPGDAREELLLAMSAAQPIDGSRLDAHWPQRRSLDLVLITIDALRPDRLGAYGSTRGLTPNLDRFLDETVVFRHAYASFPSSRRSMGGMLTGYYPSANELAAPSAADKPPLAERLADLGYRSEAFTHLPPWFLDQAMAHLRRGFDAFSNVDPGGGDTGPAVVAQALRALEAPRSRPRFVWVHLFDPHGPYRSRGAGEDSEEARYDGEVAHVDRILAPLLQLLADPRRRDDTAVVFCADHGEAFGEHRQVGHGKTVYEEEVRVPLAFRFPGVAAATIDHTAELIDIPATLLECLGTGEGAIGQGRSLLPLILANTPGFEDAMPPFDGAFCEFEIAGAPQRSAQAIRVGDLKLIQWTATGDHALFDLRRDPLETRNISRARPADFARMQDHLAAMRALIRRAAPRTPLDRLVDPSAPFALRLESLRALPKADLVEQWGRIRLILEEPEDEGLAHALLLRLWRELPPAELQVRLAEELSSPSTRARCLARTGMILAGAAADHDALIALRDACQGNDRLLALALLARDGTSNDRLALGDLTVLPALPRDTEELLVAILARSLWPDLATVIYLRSALIFTRIWAFPQMTRIVDGLDPLEAAPVHRVLLNDRSNASQSRLEGRLDDLQAWLGAAADAEQSLSQLRFGTQPPPTESAIAAHQGAFEALAATGLVDWGVLFEHLSYFVSRGDRQAALERIARWVSHRSPITRQSRYFVDRLQKMLASQGATPVWTLSAPELATIDPGSARPVWRMIEYRVPVEGQAIIGGLAPYGDLLRWRAIDAKGQPLDTWNHLALPFDGILPGETRGLLIRLTPETLARQPAALEFETRRGNRPIGEALTLSMKS